MQIVRVVLAGLVVLLYAGIVCANENRFVFSGMTATDTNTGLEWTREVDFGEPQWASRLPGKNTGDADVFDVVNELNRQMYAGHNDWRVPSFEELKTLAMYAYDMGCNGGYGAPQRAAFFNKLGFKYVKPDWYWSRDKHADVDGNTNLVWAVNMRSSEIGALWAGFPSPVWPVRGNIKNSYSNTKFYYFPDSAK